MGRRRQPLDINPDHVIVDFVRLGRGEDAVAELKARFDKAPFEQRQLLRERLAQAVELFAEARARNDRLFPNRR
jgi:hypothetical protein